VVAKGTGRAQSLYAAVDKARGEATIGEAPEPEPRPDVPDPMAEDKARGLSYSQTRVRA
jgi:hypothetical protein